MIRSYLSGKQKYCSRCGIFIKTRRARCQYCGVILRLSPRKKKNMNFKYIVIDPE